MHRRLALPAAVALTLHLFLLFGFTAVRRAAPPRRPAAPVARTLLALELPRDASAEPAASTPSSAPLPPLLPEPAPVPSLSPEPSFHPVIREAAVRSPTLAIEPLAFAGTAHGDDLLSGSGAALDAALLDAMPRARAQPPPAYPATARASGLEGEVVVEFVVDPLGRVHDARVVRSTEAVFEETTLRAVAHWRFEPGTRGGTPVAFRLRLPVVFKVTD